MPRDDMHNCELQLFGCGELFGSQLGWFGVCLHICLLMMVHCNTCLHVISSTGMALMVVTLVLWQGVFHRRIWCLVGWCNSPDHGGLHTGSREPLHVVHLQSYKLYPSTCREQINHQSEEHQPSRSPSWSMHCEADPKTWLVSRNTSDDDLIDGLH